MGGSELKSLVYFSLNYVAVVSAGENQLPIVDGFGFRSLSTTPYTVMVEAHLHILH